MISVFHALQKTQIGSQHAIIPQLGEREIDAVVNRMAKFARKFKGPRHNGRLVDEPD